MKTFVPFMKLVCVLLTAVLSGNVVAQSGPGGGSNNNANPSNDYLLSNGLSFKNPSLETANTTDLKKGAVYLFEDVKAGVDARLKIDSLVNGAKVIKIDDNSNGLGYKDALQPEIQSGNVIGRSYAVFTLSFYKSNTLIPEILQSVSATALDIDGNLNLKEFAETRMGNGAVAKYMSTTLDISLLDMLLGKFKGENILGIERAGIDTSAMSNMFTTSNAGISSFTFKYGTTTLLPTNDIRQFSMYMKGFSYPSQVTLPVDLISFNAMLNGSKVDLKWETASEKNVSHFVVEKSVDGKEYSDAGVVFAYGNSTAKVNYSFSDTKINATNTVIYYRLRTVNIDEKNQYSSIRVIRLEKENNKAVSILTYPNPATNELRVTVPANWQGKKISYEILSNNGRLTIRTESGSSSQTETINVSKLTAGVYMVKVTCNGETATQKIVKQ
ncbi:MAG: T9SS type A sorting domain-containing protein [Chitinophagaceae bacterium]